MRILFVASQLYFPQLYGGVQTSTDQLAHALIARGHHVSLLVSLMPGGFFGWMSRIKMQMNNWRHGFKVAKDDTYGYPIWRAWFPEQALEFVAKHENVDLIVIMSGKMMPLVPAAKKTGLPLLFQLHDVASENQGGDLTELVGYPCVANSQFTANHYQKLFGIQSTVIYPFVETEKYRTATQRQNITFVNPHPRKGLEVALQIARAYPHIPFTFIEGWTLSPEQRSDLMEKLASLPNITLLPSQDDMREIYSTCKILLVPSICEEAFGRVVSEAQASGIPILSSNRGGLPEAVGPGGILLDPEGPIEAWIRAVQTLWDDDAAYLQFSTAARSHSQRIEMDFTHQIDAHERALLAACQQPLLSPPATKKKFQGSVCAIIPTYNRAGMLRECINSILTQTYPPQQIIVVNDGSTDDTEVVVRSFGDNVQLITTPNSGKAAAINMALKQCTTDYVWICDDDDVAINDGLEYLINVLDANPELGFVYGYFKIFKDTPNGRIYMPPSYWHRTNETNVRINFLEEMFTFQYAMLTRRILFEQTGPFREDLMRSQDYEMILRLVQNAACAFVPQIIFHQRQHAGTRGTADDSFDAEKSIHKWLTYDQKIFNDIRRSWSLDEFTPSFAANWPPDMAQRAALVERACVFAKRALWHEATTDLKQATMGTNAAPSNDEIKLAESVIRTFLSWIMLAKDSPSINELHNIYGMNPFGHGIVLAVCRPLVWHTRKLLSLGKFRDGIGMLWLLYRIVGWRGFVWRLSKSAFKL